MILLQDRFVLVFLKDNDAANSRIIVCFSSTNNPSDPWHVYRLNGNPLNNNRWTDFPAISLSETGLVVTANLIIPGVSWQVGFDGSVIWHLDKMAGFNGQDVGATVYTQISHDGKFTRNLHAVRGHDNIADQLQFLSNRNFDLQNDTIFLITLNEGADTTIDTKALITNLPYGVPPNGKQGDTDTSDATKGLQTNDGRVLGAIQKDDWIQFVSTTTHGNNANAGIYHGYISNAQGETPQVALEFSITATEIMAIRILPGQERTRIKFNASLGLTTPPYKGIQVLGRYNWVTIPLSPTLLI